MTYESGTWLAWHSAMIFAVVPPSHRWSWLQWLQLWEEAEGCWVWPNGNGGRLGHGSYNCYRSEEARKLYNWIWLRYVSYWKCEALEWLYRRRMRKWIAVHMEGVELTSYSGFKTTIDQMEDLNIGGSIILKSILKIEEVNWKKGATFLWYTKIW